MVNLCPHIFITTEACDCIFHIQQGQRGLDSMTGEKVAAKIHVARPKQLLASQFISLYSQLEKGRDVPPHPPVQNHSLFNQHLTRNHCRKTYKYVMNNLAGYFSIACSGVSLCLQIYLDLGSVAIFSPYCSFYVLLKIRKQFQSTSLSFLSFSFSDSWPSCEEAFSALRRLLSLLLYPDCTEDS